MAPHNENQSIRLRRILPLAPIFLRVLSIAAVAWTCAPSARAGDDAKVVFAELAHDLKAARPETRRSAVKKLGALGTREALELVVGALDDHNGQVADEAEIQLGRSADPKVIDVLAGRAGLDARDPWVRVRAAGALGRVPMRLDARLLLGAVEAREPELARAALFAIELQARAKRLVADPKALAKSLLGFMTQSTLAPDARGRALIALSVVDALEAQAQLTELLAAREPALRCAALWVARGLTEVEGTRFAASALADENEGVRMAAVLDLEAWSGRDAVLALIGLLEHEERSRVRWEVLRHLRSMSGTDHGLDLAAWRAWAATVQGRSTTGDAKPWTGPLGDTRVAFAGLPMLSDRVAFLIDLSGSMWQTKVGEKTRKELVDERVRAVLEALPATAAFNVIPYTAGPFPWEKRLVRANPQNKKRAVDAFERCHQSGPGDVWDAIELALDDPEIDTICVLTDGVPTGGRRWNLELLVELLVERNRFRNIAFDSVLVDAPKLQRKLWGDLAQRTGGRSISIELGAPNPKTPAPGK